MTPTPTPGRDPAKEERVAQPGRMSLDTAAPRLPGMEPTVDLYLRPGSPAYDRVVEALVGLSSLPVSLVAGRWDGDRWVQSRTYGQFWRTEGEGTPLLFWESGAGGGVEMPTLAPGREDAQLRAALIESSGYEVVSIAALKEDSQGKLGYLPIYDEALNRKEPFADPFIDARLLVGRTVEIGFEYHENVTPFLRREWTQFTPTNIVRVAAVTRSGKITLESPGEDPKPWTLGSEEYEIGFINVVSPSARVEYVRADERGIENIRARFQYGTPVEVELREDSTTVKGVFGGVGPEHSGAFLTLISQRGGMFCPPDPQASFTYVPLASIRSLQTAGYHQANDPYLVKRGSVAQGISISIPTGRGSGFSTVKEKLPLMRVFPSVYHREV